MKERNVWVRYFDINQFFIHLDSVTIFIRSTFNGWFAIYNITVKFVPNMNEKHDTSSFTASYIKVYYYLNYIYSYYSGFDQCNERRLYSVTSSLTGWALTQNFHNRMMTSSNGNIYRVTDHLCGEFTGHRWIPRTKASDAELWCFLWSASE